MPMDVILTHGELILHLSVARAANICHFLEDTFSKDATLRKWDVHRNCLRVQHSRCALPLGVAARLSPGRTVYSYRSTCSNSFSKNSKHQPSLLFLLFCHHLQKSLALKGPLTWRASRRLNHVFFLSCAKTLLWFKIMTSVSARRYANMHLFAWRCEGYARHLAESRTRRSHSGRMLWYWWTFQSCFRVTSSAEVEVTWWQLHSFD